MPAKKAVKIQLNEGLFLSEKQHEELLSYLTARLDFGHEQRKTQIDKYRVIDRELAGFLIRDQEDDERSRDNRAGHGPKPVDNNWGFVIAQLDEAVTFLISVLAPDEGIYNAVAPVDKQSVAKGLSVLMNKHAEVYDHYPNLVLGLLNALRYNFAPWMVEWETTIGSKLKNNDASNTPEVLGNEVVFEGNSHDALDPYNFLYDISVMPSDLPNDGEFFATVDRRTEFRIRQEAAKKQIYGLERFINTVNATSTYYEEKPEIRGEDFSAGQTNWFSLLAQQSGKHQIGKGFEKINMYCWLPAKDLGLTPKKQITSQDTSQTEAMTIWQFTIINAKHIVFAQQLQNAHGMLPCAITTPVQDGFFPNSRSHAEVLIPAQQFSSFQLNMHQRSQRKSLIGLTLFNERVLPQLANETVDIIGGRVPAQNVPPDFDINKAIAHFNDGPKTDNTLADVEATDKIMQKLMPTNIQNQVAGLERATQYQAAAVVQGANRRNLKIAKLINSQALQKTRRMQYYNIMQFQQTATVLDETGKETTINPTDLRDTQLEFTIDAGMRGLDRLALIINMKEMFNSMLQSQQAIQQIDVLKWMNYLTSLMGDHTDFNQFKIESPLDTMSPEAKNIAYKLLQQFVEQQKAQQGAAGGQGETSGGTPGPAPASGAPQ